MTVCHILEESFILIWHYELKWKLKEIEVVDEVPVDLDIFCSKDVHISLDDCLVVQINHEMLLDQVSEQGGMVEWNDGWSGW